MDPQDPRVTSLPFSQPLAVAASVTIPQVHDVAYGLDPQHIRTPSTTDSSDRSQHSPALEGNPLNMAQSSTALDTTIASTAATFATHTLGSAEFKRLQNGSYAPKIEGEGEVDDDKKKEREHKKRSKNWTRLETLKLIKARTELDEQFTKSGRKFALWDEIAQTLRRAGFARDAQQCKDKWEKLTAGYKEVRDGARDREDHPFYDELHQLLSWKPHTTVDAKRVKAEFASGHLPSRKEKQVPCCAVNGSIHVELREDQREETSSPAKRKRASECLAFTDLAVVQDLLETVITRQQRFFKELLDAVERKEQLREQIRHEREEKWRAEERTQRYAFNNAMIVLTQRLMGPGATAIVPAPPIVVPQDGAIGPKKRSKNWKRTEVLHLIRFRREMEARFSKSTRRAALWEELGGKLLSVGIKRDGKQCREKWDKLMAEYKDVTDGRKDKDESPYFAELNAFVGRTVEEEANIPQETAKEEFVDT